MRRRVLIVQFPFAADAYVQLLTMEGPSLMMILGVACRVLEPVSNYVVTVTVLDNWRLCLMVVVYV